MKTFLLTAISMAFSAFTGQCQSGSDFEALKGISRKMLAHRSETLMVKRQNMSPYDFELKGDGYSVTSSDSTGFTVQCDPEKGSGYKTIEFEQLGKKYLVTQTDCRYDVYGVTVVTTNGGARTIMPKCQKTELRMIEKRLMDEFGDLFWAMFKWKPEVTK